MHLGSWHTGQAYTQGCRHLSDWTSSNSSLLKFPLWFALFLGSLQRCWASDPSEQCQSILEDATRVVGWGHLSGYMDCIRQDSHCQDMPVPCQGHECDAEADLTEWVAALYGADAWPVQSRHARQLLVSTACPLTCKVCGPHKADRQVRPIVATILRGPCEHGWHYADSACFKYSWSRSMSWFSAENACQAEGAHLATVMTKVQAHKVFDLIRQCPSHLGRRCLWAWVGRWTQCSQNSSNWTWIGTPQLEISSSPLHSLFPADCQHQSAGPAWAAHTHSMSWGRSFDFGTRRADHVLRAWLCSKPALFHPVTEGRCQDVGLSPIHDLGACEAAFKVLVGIDAPAIRIEDTERPFGCHVGRVSKGPELNTEPGTDAVSAGQDGILLCQAANATSQAAGDPDLGLTGQWEGVRTSDVPPSFSQPLLVSLLAASFLPAFVVVAVRRRDLVALCRLTLLLLSSLRSRACKRGSGAPDHSVMLAARLRQKRRTIASVSAAVVAGYHLFELIRICLVEESVCTSAAAHPQLRLFLALVHLGSLWLASAFLALTYGRAQNSSRPDLALLLAIAVLDVVQTALIGEQALLVESRLYSQLLWRLLLGACASPVIVLMGGILHLIGVGAVYKALIPDGFIFTVGSTRAGLLYHQGCNQLWSQADALTGKDLLLDMSRLSGLTDVSARRSLQALLDELLKKQTSFNDFVQSEVLLLAIVMACLVFLNTLMSREISKSLRLQVSEDQLLAVSQVMDSLCDATCQLSRNLRICCSAQKLDGILRMSPSGPSALEGADFCGIIACEEERAGFRAFVERGIRQGFKSAYYLDLKGASSARVRMQVLCAHFADALGHPRVLCGFTELQSGGHGEAEAPADSLAPLAPGRAEPQRRRHRSRRGTSSSSGSSSRGSSSGSIGSKREEGPRAEERLHSAPSVASSSGDGVDVPRSSREPKRMKVEVKLDETLRVVNTNRAFMRFIGAGPQQSASLLPFLAEPEAQAELLRACGDGMGSEEVGAPRVIDVVFNAAGTAGALPCQAVCRATPGRSADDSEGPTLKLEILEVGRPHASPSGASGSSELPTAGPYSLGRSLADRLSM